ncbi:MAG: sulfatase [Spirochaetota bacterium]
MRPNILLITTDEHRPDCIGSGGFGSLRTPALDRLASEGTTFGNAYSNCPICMPTRFTWLHGLYASQANQRLLQNAHDWPTDLPTFTQALQRAGYRTGLVGKLHSLAGLYHRDIRSHRYETMRRGFDDLVETSGGTLSLYYDCDWTRYLDGKGLLEKYREFARWWMSERPKDEERYEPFFLEPEDTLDGFTAREAVGMLETYATRGGTSKSDGPAQPFFLHVSFAGPHFPIVPAERYYRRYSVDDVPEPAGLDDPGKRARWRRNRALYAAFVEQTDAQIAQVLDALEANGLSEETLVIFTCDHGELIGDHGLNHKGKPYDSAVRTPAIVRLPGSVPVDVRCDAILEAVDLPATILDAAGLGDDPDRHLPQTPSRSWWPCALGQRQEHRTWAFSEAGVLPGGWRMAADRRYKYVFRPDRDDLLFNLESDPTELDNLALDPAYAAVREEFQRRVVHSMMSCVPPNRDGNRCEAIHGGRPRNAIL